ncbi:MAG: hypothetical protein ABJG68_02175 [Crocinitomicaceae bacterium]
MAFIFAGLSIASFIYSFWQVYVSTDYSGVRSFAELSSISVALAILALLFTWLKYRTLSFKEISGTVSKAEITAAFKRLEMDRSWHQLELDVQDAFQFVVMPHNYSTSKLVTVILKDDKILFNAIRRLDAEFRSGEQLYKSSKTLNCFLYHLNAVRKKEEFRPIPEFNNNQWSIKMILIRLFLYPFCIFLIYTSLFLIIPEGRFDLAIPILALSIGYIFSDLYMIFKKKK